MNIRQMNDPKYRHCQPCDLYSLILDPNGIKSVEWKSGFIIPDSLRDPVTDRVVRDWVDYRGWIGPKDTAWTPKTLSNNFKKWSRGAIDLPITQEEADHLIDEARAAGVYFYGDWHPYYGKK